MFKKLNKVHIFIMDGISQWFLLEACWFVCVNFISDQKRSVFYSLFWNCMLPALWGNQLSSFVIRLSQSIRNSVPHTSNTYTVLYARKQHTCNSVSFLRCFAQYTFTSTFYLLKEHLVTFCKFNVNVWVLINCTSTNAFLGISPSGIALEKDPTVPT